MLPRHSAAAGASACRVEELAVEPSNFVISPQTAQSKAAFDSLGQSMALNLNGNGVTKATVNFPAQLYGQLEVLARVSVHPGVVTSIDVSMAAHYKVHLLLMQETGPRSQTSSRAKARTWWGYDIIVHS